MRRDLFPAAPTGATDPSTKTAKLNALLRFEAQINDAESRRQRVLEVASEGQARPSVPRVGSDLRRGTREARRGGARRSWIAWLLPVPLLLVAGAGVLWHQNRAEDKAGTYVTAQVEVGDIEETVSALGTVQPSQYVDVGTQVTGQLKVLHVRIGDVVERGALVAEIDPTLLASRVGATRATLENLHAQLAERRAQQRLAEQQDKRNRMLFKAGAASEEVVQQSAAAVEQLASQRAALQAQIQQMQSQLDGDEANLRYTKIHAPMTGTVVSLTAREGQTLVASQQAPIILRVADLKTVTVWAQVSEADVPKIALGMPVYFNTLGQPERRWHGKVRQVLPTPETVNNVILYNVLFDVANPDQALKPQMSAQSYFVLAKATGALLVPTAALQPAGRKGGGKKSKQSDPDALAASTEGERRYSVRVLQEGVVAEREVTVGAMTRVSAQVLSGLARGEQVIVGTEPEKSKDKAKPRARLGRP